MPGFASRSATLLLVVLVAGCGSTTGSGTAGSESGSEPPARPPDDFSITEGMPSNDSGEPIAAGADGVGMRMLDFCGVRPLRGLAVVDRVTATSSGPEYSATRDLMVLADARQAAVLAAQVLDAARACPVEESGPGSEVLTEVRRSTAAPAAATVVHTYRTGGRVGVGAEIIEVVPVGATLLVTSAYGEWSPGPILDEGITQGVEALAPVLAAMRGGQPVPTATIPADFPLDLDLPRDDGDHDVTSPSPGADGVGEVEVCGSIVWPAGAVEARLATDAHGPEHVDARDLVVLADADVATTVPPQVRGVVEACTDAPAHQVWTLHEADTGHDSVTFSLTWDDGPGASVFQLTRVGSALLLTHVYGEGLLDPIGPTLRERTVLTREIAPAMCVFTADGC
ncbi:hypothetical protein [Nocardioides sp. P5_C9_2]